MRCALTFSSRKCWPVAHAVSFPPGAAFGRRDISDAGRGGYASELHRCLIAARSAIERNRHVLLHAKVRRPYLSIEGAVRRRTWVKL